MNRKSPHQVEVFLQKHKSKILNSFIKKCRYEAMHYKLWKLEHITTRYFGTISQSHCKLAWEQLKITSEAK